MKIALNIIGVLLALMGLVWILQGLNILPTGFMAGQIKWAINGAISVVIGAGLLFIASRRKPG